MILVTGATGYVGGRLVAAFERQDVPVRCLARRPEYLRARVAPSTEVVRGDVLNRASLDAALAGVDVAYYLVHSMSAEDFESDDRRSIRHETMVHDDTAARVLGIRPTGMRDAIAAALRNEDAEFAATRWSDALSAGGPVADWENVRFGSRLIDSRATRVAVPPAAAFAPIRRIGGRTGWYYADWLWDLRAWLDLLFGGIGDRRARRDPEQLRVGDTLDWWRVEAYEPDRRLRLYAEMKVPGRAWLEFEVAPDGAGSAIRQTALFDPVGLPGLAYWWLVYPLHQLVFRGMLRAIARAAERRTPAS